MRFTGALAALVVLTTTTARAERVPLSPEELKAEATHIVTGVVKAVYSREVETTSYGKGTLETHYLLEIEVRGVEKGSGVGKGDLVYARTRRAGAPSGKEGEATIWFLVALSCCSEPRRLSCSLPSLVCFTCPMSPAPRGPHLAKASMSVCSWSGPNLPTRPLTYRMSSSGMPASSSGGSQPGPTPRGAKGKWPVRPGRKRDGQGAVRPIRPPTGAARRNGAGMRAVLPGTALPVYGDGRGGVTENPTAREEKKGGRSRLPNRPPPIRDIRGGTRSAGDYARGTPPGQDGVSAGRLNPGRLPAPVRFRNGSRPPECSHTGRLWCGGLRGSPPVVSGHENSSIPAPAATCQGQMTYV
jgi:hypothetical protein